MQKGKAMKEFLIFLGIALTAQAELILYECAMIHTADQPSIKGGRMLVKDGQILKVGENIKLPAGALKMDLGKLHLYPGLIAPATSLGLTEINAVRATQDTTEVGDFTPDVEAWISVNPDSELIPVARANGFTHVLVAPMGGIVSGTSGLIRTSGWGVEDMTVKARAALHVWWPTLSINTRPKESLRDPEKYKSPKEQARKREEKLRKIDRFFDEAEAYAKARKADKKLRIVPAWEAMLPAVNGKHPIMIHANYERQITSAIKWADKRGYRIIIAAGLDAWRVADQLAKSNVPVILDNVFRLPQRDTDAHNVNFKAAGILNKAGVKVSHSVRMGNWGATEIRNIVYAAARSMAYGLSREAALKSITLNPAQILGVEKRLGSLTPGKEATFIAVDGDIFDIRANVKGMWVKGKEVSLQSRHTRLYDKYRKRPKPAAVKGAE